MFDVLIRVQELITISYLHLIFKVDSRSQRRWLNWIVKQLENWIVSNSHWDICWRWGSNPCAFRTKSLHCNSISDRISWGITILVSFNVHSQCVRWFLKEIDLSKGLKPCHNWWKSWNIRDWNIDWSRSNSYRRIYCTSSRARSSWRWRTWGWLRSLIGLVNWSIILVEILGISIKCNSEESSINNWERWGIH